VLAGELAAADGDHRVAFARYEALLPPYVARTSNSRQVESTATRR
jgi:hypothetical protein